MSFSIGPYLECQVAKINKVTSPECVSSHSVLSRDSRTSLETLQTRKEKEETEMFSV